MQQFFLIFLCVALASAKIVPQEPGVFGYHEFGMKELERIRVAEEEGLKNPLRIVGGQHASVGQLPYQAGILISLKGISGKSVCGASLISAKRLLTAAHCWHDGQYQATQFEVVLGSIYLFTGGVRTKTNKVETHSNWNATTFENDIAMISLLQPVELSNVIQPVSLLSSSVNLTGYVATASGYGKTSDSQVQIPSNQQLSFVNLNVISNSVCSLVLSDYILSSNICTSGLVNKGPCNGDSGGPLVAEVGGTAHLIGIVSFSRSRTCQAGDPTAYARITYFYSWITARM